MSKAAVFAALVAVLAAGAAVPMVWSDDAVVKPRRISVAEAERQLSGSWSRIGPGSDRPRVPCRPRDADSYACLVRYSETGEAIVTYEIDTPAYERSP